MSGEGGVLAVHGALGASVRSVVRHSVSTVLISVLWVVASLPVVTVGAATLGAYAAIRSVRETGRVDRGEVARTLSKQGLNASLLGGALLALVVLFVLYLDQFLATGGATAALLAVGTLYLAVHLWTVLVVTFVLLVDGADLGDAIVAGYRWSVERPVTTVLVGVVTAALFAVCAVFTVALVVLFPALVFKFHTELVVETSPIPTA